MHLCSIDTNNVDVLVHGVGSKINHSSTPNATFCKVKLNGLKRVLVVSLEWIFENTEITVDYGAATTF
jgi:SET domain-containing protein